MSPILLVLVLVLGIPDKVEEEEHENEEEPAAVACYPARSFISKSLLSTVSPTTTKI